MDASQSFYILPEELLWEIMSLLSVKTLMRFKCVCKSWNFIISDPTFVKLRLQRSSTHSSVLCLCDNHKELCFIHSSVECLFEDPLSILKDHGHQLLKKSYNIVGVCNGLVCLTTTTFASGDWKVWIRFWNPATRVRSRKLYIGSQHEMHLSRKYVNLGFGYDDSKDTYKVVVVDSVVLNSIPLEAEVRVHCLGHNYSRKVANWSGFPKLPPYSYQAYVGSTLNWLAETSDKHIIFSFDLRTENYKHLLLPRGLVVFNRFRLRLVVLRNCLCLLQYYRGTNNKFCVWQMKEFGVEESWTLLLNISPEPLIPIFGIYSYFFLLYISENGNVLLLGEGGSKFAAAIYNLRDNTLEQVQVPIDCKNDFIRLFDYVESLVLPY